MNIDGKLFVDGITWNEEYSFYNKLSWEDIRPTRSNAEKYSWHMYDDFLTKFSNISISYSDYGNVEEQKLPESYPKGDIDVLLGIGE